MLIWNLKKNCMGFPLKINHTLILDEGLVWVSRENSHKKRCRFPQILGGNPQAKKQKSKMSSLKAIPHLYPSMKPGWQGKRGMSLCPSSWIIPGHMSSKLIMIQCPMMYIHLLQPRHPAMQILLNHSEWCPAICRKNSTNHQHNSLRSLTRSEWHHQVPAANNKQRRMVSQVMSLTKSSINIFAWGSP